MKIRLIIGLILLLSLNACAKQSHYESLPTDNVGRLMQIEDFKNVKQHCPVFGREALLTVNSLQYQIAELKAQQGIK